MKKVKVNNKTIKDLLELIDYLPDELNLEEFINKFLISLRKAETLHDASIMCVLARYIFRNFKSFSKKYKKKHSYFQTKDDNSLGIKLNLEEDALSCYVTDIFTFKEDSIFFGDALYDGYYSMKKVKKSFDYIENGSLKYKLLIKNKKFKILDANLKVILEAKAKSEKKIKFIKNETPYSFIFNKKFNSFEIYLKSYADSVKKKNNLNYDESSLGVIEGNILKIRYRFDKYKFVVSKTTYFEELKDHTLLNILSFALISISKNKFLSYFK